MQTTFELHTCIRGRWSIEQVFTSKEKAMAIDEGMRRLGLKHVGAVRVVRETYDKDTNESTEMTVYDSSRPQAAHPAPKSAGTKKSTSKAAEKPENLKRVKQKRKTGSVVGTALMALAFIVAIAVLIIVVSRGQSLLGG